VKVDDDLRRKEEEELQRVLEMSVHDKGGREPWSNYLASGNGAGGSGSGSSSALHTSQPAQRVESHRRTDSLPSAGASGSTAQIPVPGGSYTQPPRAEPPSPIVQATPTEVQTTSPQSPTVTRVRALHKFEATEPGELAFEKGDVIKVVDRIYKDWWRGQLRGRTGIFPVNYVVSSFSL
jgi:signal transducing adaptor molecule